MVISDIQKQVFCHIPKNGGSSLRRHLLETWADARQYTECVPVAAANGAIRDLTHLTISEAKAYFDEDLVAKGYKILAIVREPRARVRSALYQYLRVVYADQRDFIGSTDAVEFLRTVSLPELCERSAEDYTCIHFRPQAAFIEGVPEANLELIPLKTLGQRFPDLPHNNPTGSLPSWLRPFDRPFIRAAFRSLGSGFRQRIRGALTRRDDAIQTEIAQIAENELEFIDTFYAADRMLYQQVFETNHEQI